jgi:hypothetical protein
MSKYHITDYSKEKAKKIGVIIKPSKDPKKKIDVFGHFGNFICSIGSANMGDFPTYLKSHGLEFARERRRLYRKRHEEDRHERNTKGWYADQILW